MLFSSYHNNKKYSITKSIYMYNNMNKLTANKDTKTG